MPIMSVGDTAQQFQSLRQTGMIKDRLNTLAQQMSSGRYADVTERTGGNVSRLAGIEREISLLEIYDRNTTEVGQTLSYMQASLEIVDGMRSQLTDQTLAINVNTSTPTVKDAASSARAVFDGIVNTLNKRVGDKSLFAGVEVDATALASGEDMLADLALALSGVTTAAAISTAVDTWFNDPTGGFATMGYLGDTGAPIDRKIGSNQSVSLEAKADDPAVREVLRAAATAAITDVLGGGISDTTRAELVEEAGQRLLASAYPLTQLRAQVGVSEARVTEVSVTQSAEKTAYEMSRNAIVAADPFATATQLQDVQTQLEMHYSVTARLSQLSLVNYLR